MRGLRSALGLLTLVLVAVGPCLALNPSVSRAQLLSPGALARSHAELEGDDNCNECHASGRRVSDDLCRHCHSDLSRRIRAGQGLHGREYTDRECARCHVDHLGRGTRLIRWPGGSPEQLDHNLTGWPLAGGHIGAGCRDCHNRRNSRGNRTYLGAPKACNACHEEEDPHNGRFGTRCQTCHRELRWQAVSMDDFDHSLARFALRGKHREVECRGCHSEPPRYRGIDFGICASCHRDPHEGRFGAVCTGCHSEEGWDQLGDIRQNHPGLSLRNGHARVSCERCHDAGIERAPRAGRRCVGCHRPVHEAEFGNNCARCHRSIKWTGLPRRIGVAAHARTAFPLEGRHERVECQSCHQRNLPRHERYTELTYDRCDGCHEDPHQSRFADFASSNGGECAGCHTVRGFAPSLFGQEAHAATGFALEGRHSAVPCSACHQHSGRRRLDWSGAHESCASCHENPHGDQFEAEMAGGGCASCHGPSGWDRPNIDHSGWPLDGAHELVACTACHSPSEADRQQGQGASYRGAPRECNGCHDDEHAGQFLSADPIKQCPACHTTTEFSIQAFDHAADADYPLEGNHAETACESCHRAVTLRNDDEVVRYRLGYRACSDCHASPHDDEGGQ
ncbi:MAG: hypothetical protein JRH11_02325 [Deltaproteobacteria bacterium]|nr:hypothetical protein [Deltaproteobacteria bacterium]